MKIISSFKEIGRLAKLTIQQLMTTKEGRFTLVNCIVFLFLSTVGATIRYLAYSPKFIIWVESIPIAITLHIILFMGVIRHKEAFESFSYLWEISAVNVFLDFVLLIAVIVVDTFAKMVEKMSHSEILYKVSYIFFVFLDYWLLIVFITILLNQINILLYKWIIGKRSR
ncbi:MULTISPECIES: hypothetical protein [unclassified Lactococcus]|uniref:hypothetical protein n=1 Tax=unclassified Lactococcus TaxID=2643510 RepID=UPI0011C7D992|nr:MULTISPECIES: hypothetical protein [unclassified Lactococcus]MQW22482.1 hypothetical protein [Lactococcus sp. dk101]TXK45508.1 hypothetical protein FVP42_00810 [Lactococcus sp. dk310]TXK51841.1 hypothetical protein FVP43_00810 [Lactococcus sp. dk322]